MSFALYKALIQDKQNDLLQRTVNIHKKLNGKSTAMSHLAFAYSECGQIQKAKEIFQSKLSIRHTRTDDLDSAKLLLKSTEGILTCDRRIIYQTILDIYQKYDMAEPALQLWFTISNDEILRTPQFLDKLAKLLESNHIELPSDLKNKLKRQNS